jgi:hypothetical protein
MTAITTSLPARPAFPNHSAVHQPETVCVTVKPPVEIARQYGVAPVQIG